MADALLETGGKRLRSTSIAGDGVLVEVNVARAEGVAHPRGTLKRRREVRRAGAKSVHLNRQGTRIFKRRRMRGNYGIKSKVRRKSILQVSRF